MNDPHRPFDIRTFAKAVNERRIAFNMRHPGRSVPITDTLSRILEHDDTYTPRRRRLRTKPRPPLRNPRIATVMEIAASMETTVGDLLAEQAFRFTREDRRTLRWIVRKLTQLFALDDPELDRDGAAGSARR